MQANTNADVDLDAIPFSFKYLILNIFAGTDINTNDALNVAAAMTKFT